MWSVSTFRKNRCTTNTRKDDGSLPLIGVNTFLPKEHAGEVATTIELIRSTKEEKGQQIANVAAFQENRNSLAPESLKNLQQAARDRKNVFALLMGPCQI
jgi:methylmalonyl-CoA mutase